MNKNTIVVGVNDSRSAGYALEWAAAYARLTDARLRAIHVRRELGTLSPYGLLSSNVAVAELHVDADADRRIRRMYESIEPEPGWTLTHIVGRVGDVLVRESDDAALLVLGTQEHSGWGRVVDGSVSHYCLSHANVPVLARPDPEAVARRRRRSQQTADPVPEAR